MQKGQAGGCCPSGKCKYMDTVLKRGRCLVYVSGSAANQTADRIEAYAHRNCMEVIETIFADHTAIDKLKYYMERKAVNTILVRSIWDVSADKKVLIILMHMAQEHDISICEECRNYEPAVLIWDEDKNKKGFYTRTIPYGTAVYDGNNNFVRCFATDDEAWEFIKNKD